MDANGTFPLALWELISPCADTATWAKIQVLTTRLTQVGESQRRDRWIQYLAKYNGFTDSEAEA